MQKGKADGTVDLDNFAARLRALRLRAGLSQEALARQLGVSPQSVSKWENASNWPEACLILPLARLLGVTADELLTEPTPREEWEKRWQEIEEACRQRGDHAALLALAEAALKEWPGDRAFRFRRANEEYQLAALTEDEGERLRLLREAEGHFSELLRESPDNEDAGTMLVQILLAMGRRGEAEALAAGLPHREKLALLLRQGEAREKALRREITKAAAELLNLLQSDGSREACDLTAAILAAAGEPKTLIWYKLNLLLRRARLACEGGEPEAALLAIEELVAAVADFGTSPLTVETSLLFSELPEATSPAELRRWALDALAGEDLAPLREKAGFRELRAKVEAMTVE